jgi:hypothetical protein
MSDDFADAMNRLPGWVKEMGITILTASSEEVTCAWVFAEKRRQD